MPPARQQTTRTTATTDTETQPENILEDGDVLSAIEKAPIRLRDRLEHFTWAWYSIPMTTTSISLMLSSEVQPHTFPGLDAIAITIYIFGIVTFLFVTGCITYRFIRWRHTFRASIVHPTEGLYVAAVWLSLSNIIPGIARWGIPNTGPWLLVTYNVLFWIYFVCTFISALFHYTLLYTLPELRLEDMCPSWDMHIFPFLMCGSVAATGAPHLSPDQATPMLVAGLTAQGLGFLISLFMNANYHRRMIQWGFPSPKTRPSMFIAVGPPAFTALGVLGMADAFPDSYINYFGTWYFDSAESQAITIQVMQVLAVCTAVFVWCLSFWFMCIAVVGMLLSRHESTFGLGWFSFVFPITGFVIATLMLGDSFHSSAIQWVGTVLSVVLVMIYLFVMTRVVIGLKNKEIMWPGKDEDVYQHERKAKMIMKDLGRWRSKDVEERM
ncbi:hypothetical protein VD0002_g6116 [Verticillium dahliae]|uniref:Malic acid transport protein n=2 Tax=Verticillium dahliae TaxID=27337 RepID=G2X582_VERDV|nr:malic acid transport protein [Verticillium dahliae VdLs.17]KAF3343036.1 hypothetical protein VdG2_09023 [Verticillium dahliae VDG2]KAH6701126.1 malic acid transport protein [Verticillium dahliae]EGY14223.1 malic acid transport protein [Verticillium dahliae VdLs.17]PNH28705.1 hypothetical protein BJF96_g8083 [Verticillium dahliae]PNH47970.1 hypothetical protein VD0004_g476 [Verticillium dahliae]